MRLAIRVLMVPALAGLVLTASGVIRPGEADAATPRVTIVDNDGPLPGH